jgi:hypothetical protein
MCGTKPFVAVLFSLGTGSRWNFSHQDAPLYFRGRNTAEKNGDILIAFSEQ